MALTITASSVAIGSATTYVEVVQVGEAVTQGQPGYKHTDDKYYRTINTSAAAANCKGIFVTPAATNGYAVIARGDIIIGATVTKSQSYYVGGVAGEIELWSDIATGDTEYVTNLGTATSTTIIHVDPDASGVTKP